MRFAVERELERVKKFWFDGIGKIMAAPDGSTLQIVQKDVSLRESPDSMAVRLTKDTNAQAVSVGNVALRDLPDATAIRLTTDENAPTLNVVQADKLYPYRQKELVKRLAERFGRVLVSPHDLQCVRKTFAVDENPTFTYAAQHSPRKYTEAFVDWLVDEYTADSLFFQKARESCRVRQGI